jgi:adenylate kinase
VKKIILLVGPGGCGKGTHGQAIADAHNLAYLSSGEVLRKMNFNTSTGALSPDELVLGFTKEFILQRTAVDIVLDGVPRNVAQARQMMSFLVELGRRIHMVVFTNTPESCVERVSKQPRPGRTEDTNPEVLTRRVEEFNLHTAPMIEYLKNHVTWREVSTQGLSVEEARPLVTEAFEFRPKIAPPMRAVAEMACSCR